MSKGNKQRGNREAKKPKQEKPKAVATAAFPNASKAAGPRLEEGQVT